MGKDFHNDPLFKVLKDYFRVNLFYKPSMVDLDVRYHVVLDNEIIIQFQVVAKNFLIIEYDGRQHMEWEPHFGSYEKFLHLQENDRIKDKLAIQKGYNLLRIPFYYESELRNILENLFSSTTISKESRGKLLEIDSFLNNKEEDIV